MSMSGAIMMMMRRSRRRKLRMKKPSRRNLWIRKLKMRKFEKLVEDEQSGDEEAEKEKVEKEKAEDEKVGADICAKLLSEWLGREEEPPGSWSNDDVSMQDFSLIDIFIYHEDSNDDH